MSRRRICALCGNPIEDNNDSVPYKKRYVHSACFNVAVKAIHVDKTEKIKQKAVEKKAAIPKSKAELKNNLTDEEYVQKNLYYEYIRVNTGIVSLPAKVYTLTDNYIKKYGFTFQGLYATLTYMKNILGKEFGEDIVGLVPYYYDEAQRHYKSVKEVGEKNKSVNINVMYHQKRIQIDTRQKKIKQIDVTSVSEE